MIAVLLGSAQDGGIPHPACRCPRCLGARQGTIPRRTAASLGIYLPQQGRRYIIDASPSLPAQLELLDSVTGEEPWDLKKPVDGVFLTHGHFGHIGGLPYLGKEVASASEVPVWCTSGLADYLQSNRPYSDLIEYQHIKLHGINAGDEVTLAPGRTLSALDVPHRTDVSDTLAFRLVGPEHSLLYVPDVDYLTRELIREASRVDYALIDGTFYSAEELGRRSAADVPHPPIGESVDKLSSAADRVWFIHLNHTNPVADPRSRLHHQVLSKGYRVPEDGHEWQL